MLCSKDFADKTAGWGNRVEWYKKSPRGKNTSRCLSRLLSPEAVCVGRSKDLTDEKVGLGS